MFILFAESLQQSDRISKLLADSNNNIVKFKNDLNGIMKFCLIESWCYITLDFRCPERFGWYQGESWKFDNRVERQYIFKEQTL